MKEALQAIIPFGFHQIGIHRIQASVFPENKASMGLLESLGFKKEGFLREYLYIKHNNIWEDCYLLALLKSSLKEGSA